MKSQRGEITTILTIGAILIMGVASFVTSFVTNKLNQKQITTSKAREVEDETMQISEESAEENSDYNQSFYEWHEAYDQYQDDKKNNTDDKSASSDSDDTEQNELSGVCKYEPWLSECGKADPMPTPVSNYSDDIPICDTGTYYEITRGLCIPIPVSADPSTSPSVTPNPSSTAQCNYFDYNACKERDRGYCVEIYGGCYKWVEEFVSGSCGVLANNDSRCEGDVLVTCSNEKLSYEPNNSECKGVSNCSYTSCQEEVMKTGGACEYLDNCWKVTENVGNPYNNGCSDSCEESCSSIPGYVCTPCPGGGKKCIDANQMNQPPVGCSINCSSCGDWKCVADPGAPPGCYRCVPENGCPGGDKYNDCNYCSLLGLRCSSGIKEGCWECIGDEGAAQLKLTPTLASEPSPNYQVTKTTVIKLVDPKQFFTMPDGSKLPEGYELWCANNTCILKKS